MNDYFNIPQITNNYTFFALGSTVWQTWQKPKNSNFVYITAIGGGGGGGGTPNTLGNVGGAGGGGSSSITKILLATTLIPDILYINVGMGGIGGVSSNPGGNGNLTTISIEPNNIVNNVIIKSGDNVATGGSAGTTLGGGDSGVAGTVFTSISGYLSYLGIWSSFVGSDGAIGAGAGTAQGGLITPLTASITSGGAGGGGKTNTSGGAGGSIIANGVLGRSGGGTPNVGGRGTNGTLTINPLLLTNTSSKLPFATTGGAGGGSGADTGSVAGGTGGNGQYGSGGGGAGAGAGSPGGRGGNGGDGIVFITVF